MITNRVWCAQHSIISLLWLGYCCCYIIRMPLSLVKEDLVIEMGVSAEFLGCLDAALLLPYALISMTMGSLAHRFPPNIIAGMGLALSAFSIAFIGHLNSISLMPILLFFTGAFQALCWPATVAVTDNWFSSVDHNYALGLLGTSSFGGSVLSTYLIVLIESRYGWRSIFLPCSILSIAVGMLVTFFAVPPQKYGIEIRDPVQDFLTKDRIDLLKDRNPEVEIINKKPLTFFSLLRHELVPLAALSMFCNKFVRYTLMFWLPMYLQHNLGYTNLGAGIGSTAFDYGGVAGNLFNSFLVAGLFKNSNWAGAVAGNIAASFFILMFALTVRLGVFTHMSLLFLSGMGVSFADLILTGPIPSKLGKSSGSTLTVSGFINGAGSVGAVIQGPLIGWIVTTRGWNATLMLLVVVTGFAALTANMARRRAQRNPHLMET